MTLPMNEVRIDVYRPACPGPWDSAMTMTHLPTGIWVRGGGKSEGKLRVELLHLLEAKVQDYRELHD